MNYRPPLAYRVHRIVLVVMFVVVALLFGLGAVLAAEPVWERIADLIVSTRAQWSSK